MTGEQDSLEFERTKLLNKLDLRLGQIQNVVRGIWVLTIISTVAVISIAIKLWFFNA